MFSRRNFFPRIAFITYLVFVILCKFNILLGQEYFARGIFGLNDPSNFHLNNNEIQLIYGININYLFGAVNDEPSVMIFCRDSTEGSIKMNVECDPTGYQYHVYDPLTPPYYYDYKTDHFWPYMSRSHATHIDTTITEIERFVNNVHNAYGTDASGLATILLSHQGYTNDPGHWPFIQYASVLIQENFGDNVRSVVIDNADRYSGSTLENFFSGVDTLDVFHFELYPFYELNEPYPPNDSADFVGYDFQTTIIDNRIISNYNHAWQSLINSSNNHTKLEMIIQTQREWVQSLYDIKFLRRPTEAEIWLQAFLALSRNFKGIHAYVYLSQPSSLIWGLVNEASPRQAVNPWYGYVSELYDYLSVLGPKLLHKNVNEAFTWTGTPHQYIQNISGDTLDGTHRTIEVAIFDQIATEEQTLDYFMLINRRCSRDINGTPAFLQHITLTIEPYVSGSYQIRDLYSDEIVVTNNNTFEDIELLAGRGRVFELTRVFFDISGTALYYDTLAVPGAILTLTRDQQMFIETTDANGDYLFENIDGGEVTVTIEKEFDVANAITAYDAAWVLQYGVGLRDFTPYQMIAGDVTGNNAVTAYDAALILQYTVDLINKFPIMPDSSHFWRFVPEDFAINDNNWYYAWS